MGFYGPAKGLARSFDNSPATPRNALQALQVPLQVACRSHRCRMAIMPSPHPRITLARIFRPVLALVGNLLKAQDIGARQSMIIPLRGDAGLPVSVSLTRAARVRDAWLTPVTAPENEGAAAGARYLLGAGGAFDLLPPDTWPVVLGQPPALPGPGPLPPPLPPLLPPELAPPLLVPLPLLFAMMPSVAG